MFGMPKPFTLSSWSNLCLLCCLPCRHSCSTARHGNVSVGLRRLPHRTHVHSWSNKCSMFLLSYHQFGIRSESGGSCQLWKLSDAVDVSIWSAVCAMCRL